jgi:hypothetical protein
MKTWKDAWDWAAADCDAWNRRDLDAVMSRYAEDVALSSPAVVARMGRADGWVHGKAKVREYFAIGMQAPGLHFELLHVLLGVSALSIIFRRETGVMVCDLLEFDAEDRVKRLLACYGERAA